MELRPLPQPKSIIVLGLIFLDVTLDVMERGMEMNSNAELHVFPIFMRIILEDFGVLFQCDAVITTAPTKDLFIALLGKWLEIKSNFIPLEYEKSHLFN